MVQDLIDLDSQGKEIKTFASSVIYRKMCLISKYLTLTISTEIIIAVLYFFYSYCLKSSLVTLIGKRAKENIMFCCLLICFCEKDFICRETFMQTFILMTC